MLVRMADLFRTQNVWWRGRICGICINVVLRKQTIPLYVVENTFPLSSSNNIKIRQDGSEIVPVQDGLSHLGCLRTPMYSAVQFKYCLCLPHITAQRTASFFFVCMFFGTDTIVSITMISHQCNFFSYPCNHFLLLPSLSIPFFSVSGGLFLQFLHIISPVSFSGSQSPCKPTVWTVFS